MRQTLLISMLITLLVVAAEAQEPFCTGTAADSPFAPFCAAIDRQAPHSGSFVLEEGEQSLFGRAWLARNATREINIQYFIWSSDNIGILAAEALLSAAERGVKVRVIVDDLLMDAPAESLVALARHPNIEIRIYNPVHSVGLSKGERIFNLLTDFRNANQRMHDKTMIVDGTVAITGGRNMADEYFDFNQTYNFRDRDLLVIGPVVESMQQSFERFWVDKRSRPVEELLDIEGFFVSGDDVKKEYAELHAYAANPENFEPHIARTISDLPEQFPDLLSNLTWAPTRFVADRPGKNSGEQGFKGGGAATDSLVELLEKAEKKIVIQSPYLVFPEGAIDYFKQLVARGVSVEISTNSLASTDNLMAFSGYRKQRKKILAAGINVYEFKPKPAIQLELVKRYPELAKNAPIFAIHAKSMVVDGKTTFIGTFNFDPRSANLNSEVGVVIEDAALAARVEAAIRRDMEMENSWNPRELKPDRKAPFSKRFRLKLWELFPLDALL